MCIRRSATGTAHEFSVELARSVRGHGRIYVRVLRAFLAVAFAAFLTSWTFFACSAAEDRASPCGAITDIAAGAAAGMPEQCPMPAGDLLFESLYYQNASKVGSSALAAYPLVRILTGVTDRASIVFDAPAQIAESGPNGTGLYPHTAAGVGFDYVYAQTTRASFGIGGEVHPPTSLYATSPTQSLFALDLTSAYRVSNAVTIDASATGSQAQRSGYRRLLPTTDIGLVYAFEQRTDFTLDIGGRRLARSGRTQPFGDVSLVRSLGHNVAIVTGLGTSFTPSLNTKTHYLSAGVDVRE
jgi:hypothetical protein